MIQLQCPTDPCKRSFLRERLCLSFRAHLTARRRAFLHGIREQQDKSGSGGGGGGGKRRREKPVHTSDCFSNDAVGQVDEAHFGLADVVAAAAHESAQVAPGLPDKAGGRGHKRRVKRGGGVELVPLVRVDGPDNDGAVNWLM
jgi:hypothetical protein